jgi:tripartite-type tricarboxylate transporter receptor subunit TctC
MSRSRNTVAFTFLLGVLFLAAGQRPAGAAEAPFYQGKTLTLVEGRSPGGTGSFRARAVAKYLQKHIAGNPAIVYHHVPGGGGTAAANHMANVVKRDGLTLGNIGSSMFTNAVMGAAAVRYKLDDFVYFGSASSGGPYTLITRAALGLNTVEKLKDYQGLRFAQRSIGHTMYILDRMYAYILELKEPQWVVGYSEGEIDLALSRGEADAQSNNVHTMLKESSHWMNGNYVFPLVMKNAQGRGVETAPQFPQNLPSVDRYADTHLKRAVLQFHNASRPTSAPYFAPKGIPEPALRALKEAFDRTWKDPEFIKEYSSTTGEPADPMTGEEIEEVLRQLPKDPKIKEIYTRIIAAGALPPAR